MPRVLLVICVAAVGTALAAPAQAWRNPPPVVRPWSKQDVRATLLTARFQAVDSTQQLAYIFDIVNVRSIRAVPPATWVKGQPRWYHFEVVADADPVAGDFRFSSKVSFCLHVQGAVRTAYPFSDFTLTGFDNMATALGKAPYLCKESAKAKRAVGAPKR